MSDDGLFLLEVLIDKIVFVKSPCFSDKDFKTCVTFNFLNVEPLEICDDDSPNKVPSGSMFVKNFNHGKSCLFSLKDADIKQAMSKFPIKLTIVKTLPCGCLPTKIIMGECTIDMTKEFVQARKKYLEDPASVCYQALKDSFRITSSDNAVVGDILMFLRISCFGKLIVTRFQGGQNPAAGVVAAANHKGGTAANTICNPGANAEVCPIAKDPFNSIPCDGDDPDDPCFCSGPKPDPKDPMACRNTDQYCLHVPKGKNKEFEEIGSTVNGNELKIKVPKNSSVIKKISLTHCALQSPYNTAKNPGPCDTPCGRNQISLALPSEGVCCKGAQPQETQFTCTTEGCIQASKHGQQANMAKGDNPVLPPNKDVFVLKVAKTALQGDRKCKLEMELVTPKGGEKKPEVGQLSRRIQCDAECECCIRRCRPKK